VVASIIVIEIVAGIHLRFKAGLKGHDEAYVAPQGAHRPTSHARHRQGLPAERSRMTASWKRSMGSFVVMTKAVFEPLSEHAVRRLEKARESLAGLAAGVPTELLARVLTPLVGEGSQGIRLPRPRGPNHTNVASRISRESSSSAQP